MQTPCGTMSTQLPVKSQPSARRSALACCGASLSALVGMTSAHVSMQSAPVGMLHGVGAVQRHLRWNGGKRQSHLCFELF